MPDKQNSTNDHPDEVMLQLHKEELQVSKNWVETADVTVYKNTYNEVKYIPVPVTREELIIEKKNLNPKGAADVQIETIRIPLSEEHIEVTLHPTILTNVEINKEQFEELVQVTENVKEEKLHIDTVGDLKIIGDEPISTD